MADRILKPDSGNDLVLQNDDASAKIEINEDGTIVATPSVQVDNIKIDGNTITSENTDGTVAINPNGTGKVEIVTATVECGTGSGNAVLKSSGNHDLVLQTGNSTTGFISITDGANGDIDLTPNGTGEVNISKVDIDSGAIDGTDVTVGAGKTLDVQAGTLTTSSAQKQAIIDGATIFPFDGTTDAGRIIQIKNVTSQETNDLNTTYTVRWNYSITLKSSTSKVMVFHTENPYVVQPNGYGFKIYRDSSVINDSVTTVPSGANSAEVLNTTLADSSNKPHAMYIVSGDIYWMTTQHFLDDVSSNFNAGDTVYYGHFYRKYDSTTVQVPAAGSGGNGFFRTIIMEVQK